MSAAQETYRQSVAAAGATAHASLASAITAAQTTIDAARSAVGYVPGFPTGYSTFASAIASPNAALAIARANAEQARHGTSSSPMLGPFNSIFPVANLHGDEIFFEQGEPQRIMRRRQPGRG